MPIETEKYVRKPLYVDAVKITHANFDEVVSWCQGEVLQDEVPGEGAGKRYIKVRVHNPKNIRQTKAFVGDWLLYTERGYKVYTNKAFYASFEKPQTSENGGSSTPIELEQFSASVVPEDSETDVSPIIDTRRILTEEEQQELSPDEIQELLRSGEAVLAQDVSNQL